jgi:myo-inositol-hexaphosphate 3-phosphohydrolase
MRIVLLALLAGLVAGGASAQSITVSKVKPVLETPNLPDNELESDADDPSVWLHPSDAAKSLVITAVKDGGARVYDLKGALVQTILPHEKSNGVGRINNVDVAYGLTLLDGSSVDVAVASDRGLDVIRVFKIVDAPEPLVEITAELYKRAFPERPRQDGTGSRPNPLKRESTVYGLGLWKKKDGTIIAVATQRQEPVVGTFRLVPVDGGLVDVVAEDSFRFPVVHDGQNLRQESEKDPRKDWNPQFEGLVVDQRNGMAYAGQESVGIWRIDLKSGKADKQPFYETRGARGSSFRNRDSVLARDVEGLTIYYGKGDSGYLIASSQGQGHGDDADPERPYDDSFIVFDLDGRKIPEYRGSFRVAKKGKIDAVQESDGADVLGFGIPGFPNGLFITQDGYDDDLDGLSGEEDSSNFKFVDWADIANSFDPPLAILPEIYNPRDR